jgi:hypothetical protein
MLGTSGYIRSTAGRPAAAVAAAVGVAVMGAVGVAVRGAGVGVGEGKDADWHPASNPTVPAAVTFKNWRRLNCGCSFLFLSIFHSNGKLPGAVGSIGQDYNIPVFSFLPCDYIVFQFRDLEPYTESTEKSTEGTEKPIRF